MTIETDLVIACFSVSEFPSSQRQDFERAHANSYLIAYQDGFGGIDNSSYFGEFEARHPDISWFGWQMDHLGGRHYLFGHRE